MPLDANGIWHYTSDEYAAPPVDLLNQLAASVSTRAADLDTEIALSAIAALDGTKTASPPVGTRPQVKYGRRAYTSTEGGQYMVTFAAPFPNGIGGITVTTGAGGATAAVLNGDAITTASAGVVIVGQAAGAATVIYFTAWGW